MLLLNHIVRTLHENHIICKQTLHDSYERPLTRSSYRGYPYAHLIPGIYRTLGVDLNQIYMADIRISRILS